MAAHLTLISDRPLRDYEAFLLSLMNDAEEWKIRSVVVAALLDEPLKDGGDAMTAYYNASLRDRSYAAALIQTDVTYKVAQDAVRDMLDLPDPDEEEY